MIRTQTHTHTRDSEVYIITHDIHTHTHDSEVYIITHDSSYACDSQIHYTS